jgi:hypothetical protein
MIELLQCFQWVRSGWQGAEQVAESINPGGAIVDLVDWREAC